MHRIIIFMLVCLLCIHAIAQDEAPESKVAEQLASTKAQAFQFEAEGKPLEAIQAMERAEQLVLSEKLNAELPGILIFLTTRRIRSDQLLAARETAVRMLKIDIDANGVDHWRTRVWHSTLIYIDALQKLDDAARKEVLRVDKELASVDNFIEIGRPHLAVAASQAAVDVIKKHLGTENTEYADASGKLGKALYANKQYNEAEQSLRFAVKRYQEVYGKDHPSYFNLVAKLTDTLQNLSSLQEEKGDNKQALVLQQEALDVLSANVDAWDNSLIEPRYHLVRLTRRINPQGLTPKQQLFEDNFVEDSRKEYQANGELQWEPGFLKIADLNCSRSVKSEISTELKVNFEFTGELREERGFVQWGFQLGPNGGVWIGIHRFKEGAEIREELRVDEMVWDGKQLHSGINRTWPLKLGSGEGVWEVQLDQGLLTIKHDQSQVYYTNLHNNSREQVIAVLAGASNINGLFQSIEVHGIPPRVFTNDEHHVAQAADYYRREAKKTTDHGDYQQAFQLSLTSQRYNTALYGTEHVSYADSVKALGYLLDLMGNPKEALHLFETGLEINRRVLGELHPDTAVLWNNLAYINSRLGNYDTAINMFTRSVSIMETTRGELDEQTAQSLSNLGSTIANRGDEELAREYLVRALTIRQQVLGEEHTKTADSYGLIAQYHISKGNWV